MDRRRGGRFNFGHIIGDPFALATISIAIVSFVRPEILGKCWCLIRRLARLVDRLCLVNHRRYQIAISQLCLVGNCIHALLHHRHSGCICVGLGKYLQCRGEQSLSLEGSATS